MKRSILLVLVALIGLAMVADAATLRTLYNRNGVTRDTNNIYRIYAEDWNEVVAKLAGTDSMSTTQLAIDTNGVVLDTDGDGMLIITGASAGYDEDIRFNLDDTANTCEVTSTTGMATMFWNGIQGAYGNGATSAGSIKFYEDTDNGTNAATLIGPASTADVTITLPAINGGTVALMGVDNGVSTFQTDSITADTYVYSPYFSATGGARLTQGSGTGITVNETGNMRTQVYKVSIAKEAFSAASTTQDITIATLPAKTLVQAVVMDVTEAFVCGSVCTTATLSATIGLSSADDSFIASADIDAAIATFGDADAEVGDKLDVAANTNGGYLSWAGSAVVLTGTSGTGNWGDGAGATYLSNGAITVYIIATVLP